MQTGAATLENSMEVPQKVKNPGITLLGTYPKNRRTLVQRDTCTPMLIAELFTIAKIWKQRKCPTTDEWIKKMWCVCVKWNFMQPSKKKKRKEILPFATTWMEIEGIMLSEISQSEKDNYHMISLIFGI